MSKPFAEEIKENLKRAQESLQAAKELNINKHYDIAASRAYYAAFYGAITLLLSESLEFGKHSGVISAIHQHFVKTGKLDKKFGRDLNWLFELRGVADYGEILHVTEMDAKGAMQTAEAFLEAIIKLLKEYNL